MEDNLNSDQVEEQNVPKPDTEIKQSIPDVNQPTDNFALPTLKENKPKKSKKALIIVIIIVGLLIAAAAVWYFVFYKNNTSVNHGMSSTPGTNNNVVAETDPQLIKFITPKTGEVWLDKPIAIAKQGYFSAGDEEVTDYYNVGTKGDSTIVLTNTGGIGSTCRLFEKHSDGSVSAIVYPSDTAVYNTSSNYSNEDLGMASNILIDKTTHYDSLSVPDQIKIDDKGSVVLPPIYPTIGSWYIAPADNQAYSYKETLVKSMGTSSLFKKEATNLSTSLINVSYSIRTALNTEIIMRYVPLDVDLSNYQWQIGDNFASGSDTLKAMTYGCGGGLYSLVTKSDSVTDNDVVQAGKSGNGLTIYEFKDPNNTILQKAYTEFTNGFKNGAISYKGEAINTVSDFIDRHAVILFKDKSNQWLVYVREQLAPQMGCAKPVVYLYPTTAQEVNVKVGANVKVSVPNYDVSNGWTAFAQPNGQLSVNGMQYGSLFWEGPGIGQYPEITGGTVAKQADVVGVIRLQLSQQGLNTTETNDFIAYWQDKIPATPFVRLTWFDTAQMNKLAPLQISPKPDTMIRVFLDMEGLNSPIGLPAQNLKSIPRNGFTVVEWGGLAQTKLY